MTSSGVGHRVILARHGRTAWNLEGRFQGHGDPPLDDTGRRQAAALAGELAGREVTLLASSDLRRAVQTAEVVGERLGLTVRTSPELREVDLGSWEGLTRDEAALRHPGEMAAWTSGSDVRRGGGETLEEAATRFAAGLDRLVLAAGDGLTVVVAHGLVLERVLGRLDPGFAVHLDNGAWREVVVP